MSVRAAGLIVYRIASKEVQYLLMQCSRGHHWTPPKGHVDPGESDMDTAIRETEEEAGVGKDHFKVLEDFRRELHYEVNKKPKVVVYWLAQLLDTAPEIQLSYEHKDFKWATLQEALGLTEKFPDQQELLKECDNYIKSKSASN